MAPTKPTAQAGWSPQIFTRAVLSACCGSLASVCGKVAFDSSDDSLQVQLGINRYLFSGIVVVVILLLNSVMLSLYLRVLQAVSALQASLLAFVCNYLVSMMLGVVLFGERISLQWIVGAMIMTAGAIRIAASAGSSPVKKAIKAGKTK